MSPRSILACPVLLSALLACGGNRGSPHTPPAAPVAPPRLVSLEVEAFDPVTNSVWENVGVRIVEGWMEWSGLTLENPDPQAWFYTGASGTVLFTAVDLADAGIGFAEDELGLAILESHPDDDEAWVLVELAAPGFSSVFANVRLTWDEPDVLASVGFGY